MYYKIEHNKFLIYTSINNNKRMFRNIKTAWGERDSSADVKNAYNHIKENIWISGDVIDIGENTWVVTNNTKIKLNT